MTEYPRPTCTGETDHRGESCGGCGDGGLSAHPCDTCEEPTDARRAWCDDCTPDPGALGRLLPADSCWGCGQRGEDRPIDLLVLDQAFVLTALVYECGHWAFV